MARVFVPAAMRSLTGGQDVIEAAGHNVRTVIDDLDRQFPGVKNRLCDGDELRPGLSVAIGGSIGALGLRQPVAAGDEIHFLPAVGGG